MQIKRIISAKDWFFVNHTKEANIIYRLAAWALTEDSFTIGLISVSGSSSFDKNNSMARLVTVPPTGGMYNT